MYRSQINIPCVMLIILIKGLDFFDLINIGVLNFISIYKSENHRITLLFSRGFILYP